MRLHGGRHWASRSHARICTTKLLSYFAFEYKNADNQHQLTVLTGVYVSDDHHVDELLAVGALLVVLRLRVPCPAKGQVETGGLVSVKSPNEQDEHKPGRSEMLV